MKKAVVIAGPATEVFRTGFCEGLKRHGWNASMGDSNTHHYCNLLVMWGTRRQDLIERQKRQGGEVCILERGYLGDRFAWTSVSFGGGLNGRGNFRGPFTDGSRWERHFAGLMKPWRQNPDGVALVMGQVEGDMAVRNMPVNFYRDARSAFETAGLKTDFRKHPRGQVCTPLSEALAGVRVAVTWNSNSGVDAVLAGVPTITMDKGAMAWDVSGHTLGQMPPTPDRTAWAYAMAWKQWTLDEIRSGDCWAAVGN